MTDATSIFCTLVGLAINVLQAGTAAALVLGWGACQTSDSFPKSWTVHHDENADKRNAPQTTYNLED